MKTDLSPAHQATYDMIFQHPISRNLQWRDVRAMMESLSDHVEEREETVRFSRNGQTLLVHPPRRKDFSDVHELMNIRHFLQHSSTEPRLAPVEGEHLLVVIDHRLARIYKTDLHGTIPERVVPFDRNGAGRHLHYVEDDATGQRKPEQRSFYEAIAKTLGTAQNILIFGSGTGSSSAMDQLVGELRKHHGHIAKRVVRTIVIDEQHLTEDQLLAKARDLYQQLKIRNANTPELSQ